MSTANAPSPANAPANASSSRIRRAQRSKTKLRMGLDGPAGSGKTFTGLRLAFLLARRIGSGRVAVIDTEHGKSELYQGENIDGDPWEFEILVLHTFSPSEYTAALEEVYRGGYDVVLVDGLSHAWQGQDGALELVSKKGGNSYTAWKDVTPMHTRMVETILAAPCHIICTLRSKMEHVLEQDEKGRQVPRKIGMKPIQREGMEYEFDIYGSLDYAHILTISKSRCSAVQDMIALKPGPGLIVPIIDWLEIGVQTQAPKALPSQFVSDEQLQRIVTLIQEAGLSMEKEKKACFKRYLTEDLSRLTVEQAKDYEVRLTAAKDRAARAARPDDDAEPSASPAIKPPSDKPNGAAAPPAPVAMPGEPHGLWAELAHLQNWDAETTAAQFKPVLAKRLDASGKPITRVADLSSQQCDDLCAGLKALLAKTYRGMGKASIYDAYFPGDGNGAEPANAPATANAHVPAPSP